MHPSDLPAGPGSNLAVRPALRGSVFRARLAGVVIVDILQDIPAKGPSPGYRFFSCAGCHPNMRYGFPGDGPIGVAPATTRAFQAS
jgi:hypothetical protein